MPTGLLLVNTGTPASTAVSDVRRYLREFLSDPRVIDIPAPARWLLLNLIILPFRPRKSAEAYRAIWTERGSPLLVNCLGLVSALQTELGAQFEVRLGFQYGQPRIADSIHALVEAGCDRIAVLPLFPQYAAASSGSAVEKSMAAASQYWAVPSLQVLPAFWQEHGFLDTWAERVRAGIEEHRPDHVLFSYHGVPERHCTKTDPDGRHCLKSSTCCDAIVPANRNCYRAQCFATTREVARRAGLTTPHSVSFQSRLGRTPWIKPYTDHVLDELAKSGVKRLLVVEPSFVADCLETLEEIAIRGREQFRAAGGEELVLLPSLNVGSDWVQSLAQIVRKQVVAHG